MSVPDVDFIKFYQDPMTYLVSGGNSCMPFLASYRYGKEEKEWYEKVIGALTRLGLSGLIYCWDVGEDIRPTLEDMFHNRNEDIWRSYIFNPTEFGVKLVKKFHLEDQDHCKGVVWGFRKELGRIFDESDVGFDVDLPYNKLLSLGSE